MKYDELILTQIILALLVLNADNICLLSVSCSVYSIRRTFGFSSTTFLISALFCLSAAVNAGLI